MDSNYPWAKALQVNDTSLQEWHKGLKQGESLLFKALLEKKIDEESYLIWARKQYELASVGRSFFAKDFDVEVWHSTRMEYRWTPEFLPLIIWDETLFIGCVEPPKTLPSFPRPVKLLLAPATGLNRLWKFNLGNMGVEVTMTQHFTTTDKSIKMANTNAFVPKAEEVPQKNSEPKTQPLSGLSFAGLSLDKSSPATEKATTAANNQASKAVPTPAQAPNAPKFTIDNFKLDLSPSPAPAKATTAQAAPAQATAQQTTPQKPPAPPTPTVKKVVAPPPPPLSQVATNINIKIDVPPPAVEAAMPTVATGPGKVINLNFAPANVEQIKNIDDLSAFAFKEMSQIFEKCMLLSYEEQKLLVNRWTENWSPDSKHVATPMIIDTPNIFKIAHDSRLPFHGPIAMNAANKQFFDHWNGGQVPGHITVFPIVPGAYLYGFVLGITSKEINSAKALVLVSDLVEKLNVTLEKLAA